MTDPKAQDPESASAGHLGDLPTRPSADAGGATNAIGPYRLLQKIGAGGMGEVWLAEQTEPVRRRVALKVIKAGMDTRQVVARFEAERQALAMMNHPSIAKVFDAGETPHGRPYFVMEYVPGVPITEHCDRQRLSNDERLALFVQVCEGVQHAHQKAIIHRDLKPSNVLVTVQDGRAVPKIIDFGVAKATSQRLTEKTMFTEQGVLIGTPEYMSPEQAEMTGQYVDTRTDVYSLGVMLYELVVGALPFDPMTLRSAGFAGIVRMIREEEPPRPSTRLSTLGDQSTESAKCRKVDLRTLRSQLRGDIDWITMKALEKDRTRRYGSPAELAADVTRHMKDEPVLAGPPSTAYRAGKFAKRHRVGVSAAVVSIVVLVGFAVTMAVQARRIASEREASDKVSQFLVNMLGSVNARDLGIALWKDLHARVAAVQHGRGAPQGKVNAVLTSLDEALAGVNATDTALKLLDEQVLARAGQTIERELGQEPRIAARLEHTLGDTYLKLGLYGPAERHAKRAVEIRERMLGTENPDTLRSMNILAVVYRMEGKLDEAEQLHTETIEFQRRVLGQEHRDTLLSMSNLGAVYGMKARYAEAEKLYKETLELQRRVLGQEHRDTLLSMNNLAIVYHLQGEQDEAKKLQKEALEIKRRVLGQDHPDTLMSMNNLANVYVSQGRYTEAEPLYRETLEIRRRMLGQDHPDTLRSMGNVAVVCQKQGRYTEAEPLYRETLEIKRRVLGQDHPDTLLSMNNLANVYVSQVRYTEAEPLYRETLEIMLRVLGPNHPDTMQSMISLAEVAARRGDRKQALDLLTQAVDNGWEDADSMAKDDDLQSLRGDTAFEALVARARENAAKPE